jgi:hypothetical protein
MTTTINKLALKALLLDTIVHLKHGHHLAPNYHYMKHTVCELTGVSKKCTSKTLLKSIEHIYTQAGLAEEYDRTLTRFSLA